MQITINRDSIIQGLQTASRFVSDKLNSSSALQGIYIKTEKDGIHIYSTNLTTFYHTFLKSKVDSEGQTMIFEPRKVIEFVQLLQPGDIEIELKETQFSITQKQARGVFPVIPSEEFPLPPVLTEEKTTLSKKFFTDNLPFILFTASTDESRPVLTGINFVVSEDELIIVSTDGFRLSLLKEGKKGTFSNMIIPADFLGEIVKNAKNVKDISFTYSKQESIVLFAIGDEEFYSRLIDGEFPPYERVIPTEKKTTIEVNREELLRNTKLISIFARDYSNVILYQFGKDGLTLRPKEDGNKENTSTQEITIDGEDQQVAFNFKYVIDFLNHVNAEDLIIEILRSDAPVVFKAKGNEQFIHIIMPVRIQS